MSANNNKLQHSYIPSANILLADFFKPSKVDISMSLKQPVSVRLWLAMIVAASLSYHSPIQTIISWLHLDCLVQTTATMTAKRKPNVWCHVLQCVQFMETINCLPPQKQKQILQERRAERSHWQQSAGKIFQKRWNERRRVVIRGEGKSDSFFNIRLAGNVFLHSSVCLCVFFPVAVSFTALGITRLHLKELIDSWRSWPHPLSV